MIATSPPEFRFRSDDDDNPLVSQCAGCRRKLRVSGQWSGGRRTAYSETRDTFGRKQYFCRECTEALYKK